MSETRPRGRLRGVANPAELWRLAEIAALSALACAQPVLGPLGQSPQTFVTLGADRADIVAVALLVAVGAPLVVWAAGVVVGLVVPGWRAGAHVVSLGVLAALAAVFVVRSVGGGVGLRVVGALVVGAVVVLVYRRWDPLRTFLRFGSVAPVVLLVGFLFFSPVSGLVTGGGSGVDAEASGGGDHPPVVLLVFDELPTLSLMDGSGGVDGELFPNFARLAETSTWYRDATTVSPKTAVAMPALLSGVLPERDDWTAASYIEHPDNIFSALGATHELHVQEWATELCEPSLCPPGEGAAEISPEAAELLVAPTGQAPGSLGRLLEESADLWWSEVWPLASHTADFAAAGTDDAHDLARGSLEFLSGMGPPEGDRPVFDYLHSAVPHQPWWLLASGRHYETPYPSWGMGMSDEPGEFAYWTDDEMGERWAEVSRLAHVAQLRWTDRLLGAVMDRLEELGRWDDAVVVVTSDHGVSFTRGQSLRALRPASQVEIAWVPLFVKAPGQSSGETLDDNVWLIDVVPTIAELAGLDLGWEPDGVSLVGGSQRPRGDKVVVVNEADRFERADGHDGEHHLALDADGLSEVLSQAPVGEPGDELAPWRHGPAGDLLGRTVGEVGICGGGDEAALEVPDDWQELLEPQRGDPAEALPLWLEGRIEPPSGIHTSGGVAGEVPRELVVAIGDRIAGLGTSRLIDGREEMGLWLAEPLALGATAEPEVFELVGGDDCGLVRLR